MAPEFLGDRKVATNRILSNAKEFVKTLDNAQLEIHRSVLVGMSEYVDTVRNTAVTRFMIPNKFKSTTVVRTDKRGDLVAFVRNSRGFLNRHTKMQPSRPGILTIRTGWLSNVISQKGDWKINRKATEIKFNGSGRDAKNALLWVRPQSNGYLARMTFGKNDNSGEGFLSMRLKHEKGGRGGSGARPFIRPALDTTSSKFEPTIWKRLGIATNKKL